MESTVPYSTSGEERCAVLGLDLENLRRGLNEAYPATAGSPCYLTGSIADGFGNTCSDLDIYLIVEQDSQLGGAIGADIYPSVYDKKLVEMVRFSWADLDKIKQSCLPQQWGPDTTWTLSQGGLDNYWRWATAIPIPSLGSSLEGSTAPSELGFLREHVSESVRRLWSCRRQILTDRLTRYGAMHPCTSDIARALLYAAMDEYLAARGEASLSGKWRFERLMRSGVDPGSDLFRSCWSMACALEGGDYEPVRLGEVISTLELEDIEIPMPIDRTYQVNGNAAALQSFNATWIFTQGLVTCGAAELHAACLTTLGDGRVRSAGEIASDVGNQAHSQDAFDALDDLLGIGAIRRPAERIGRSQETRVVVPEGGTSK